MNMRTILVAITVLWFNLSFVATASSECFEETGGKVVYSGSCASGSKALTLLKSFTLKFDASRQKIDASGVTIRIGASSCTIDGETVYYSKEKKSAFKLVGKRSLYLPVTAEYSNRNLEFTDSEEGSVSQRCPIDTSKPVNVEVKIDKPVPGFSIVFEGAKIYDSAKEASKSTGARIGLWIGIGIGIAILVAVLVASSVLGYCAYIRVKSRPRLVPPNMIRSNASGQRSKSEALKVQGTTNAKSTSTRVAPPRVVDAPLSDRFLRTANEGSPPSERPGTAPPTSSQAPPTSQAQPESGLMTATFRPFTSHHSDALLTTATRGTRLQTTAATTTTKGTTPTGGTSGTRETIERPNTLGDSRTSNETTEECKMPFITEVLVDKALPGDEHKLIEDLLVAPPHIRCYNLCFGHPSNHVFDRAVALLHERETNPTHLWSCIRQAVGALRDMAREITQFQDPESGKEERANIPWSFQSWYDIGLLSDEQLTDAFTMEALNQRQTTNLEQAVNSCEEQLRQLKNRREPYAKTVAVILDRLTTLRDKGTRPKAISLHSSAPSAKTRNSLVFSLALLVFSL